MDIKREVISIETPIQKVKIEVKAWLTGGERDRITSVMTEAMTYSVKKTEKDGEEKVDVVGDNTKFDGALFIRRRNAMLEQAVLSVGGEKDNILERILNLRDKDMDFVIEEVKKIVEPDAEDAEVKKSTSSTEPSSKQEEVK
jgi:hypothetical protein